jgi:hypothetical protein
VVNFDDCGLRNIARPFPSGEDFWMSCTVEESWLGGAVSPLGGEWSPRPDFAIAPVAVDDDEGADDEEEKEERDPDDDEDDAPLIGEDDLPVDEEFDEEDFDDDFDEDFEEILDEEEQEDFDEEEGNGEGSNTSFKPEFDDE